MLTGALVIVVLVSYLQKQWAALLGAFGRCRPATGRGIAGVRLCWVVFLVSLGFVQS